MKLYVASSWKNIYVDQAIEALRLAGHTVYDFKEHGFAWDDAGLKKKLISAGTLNVALQTKVSKDGFRRDYAAMEEADACVLVLPAGRSAHLEAGWFVGTDKWLVIWMPQKEPAELMYKLADDVFSELPDVVKYLKLLAGTGV